MIKGFLNMGKGLIMKIFKVFSAHNRGAIVSHEDDDLKKEKLERVILQQRIRTMDLEIDNIGRRRRQDR